MSYDLAVLEGERPVDDDAATATFVTMYERYVRPREAKDLRRRPGHGPTPSRCSSDGRI
jgi:hypothetical protein